MRSPSARGLDESQRSVEYLSRQFPVLFSQLHKEEADIKAITTKNEQMERKLSAIKHRESVQAELGRTEVNDHHSQQARLRGALDEEEGRARLIEDEVSALVAAAKTYERQIERLRSRCLEEREQQHTAELTLQRSCQELQALHEQRLELSAELREAEEHRQQLGRELQTAEETTTLAARGAGSMEHQLRDDRLRFEALDKNVGRQREELTALEQERQRMDANITESTRFLEGDVAEARKLDDVVHQYVQRNTVCLREVEKLAAELVHTRKTSSEQQHRLEEQRREVMTLREKYRVTLRLQQEKQISSESMSARLSHLRVDSVPLAERVLKEVEAETAQLKYGSSTVADQCRQQSNLRSELVQQLNAGSTAFAKLQDEFMHLSAARAQLQGNLDNVDNERNQLLIELNSVSADSQTMQRRCQDLEDKLASRIHDLGQETDNARHFRAEEKSARARIGVLEHRVDLLRTSLDGYRNAFATAKKDLPDPRRSAYASELDYNGTNDYKQDNQFAQLRTPSKQREEHVHAHTTNMKGFVRSQSSERVDQMQRSSERYELETTTGYSTGNGTRFSASHRDGDFSGADDAMRFLCEYVAREEQRLGATPELVT